MTPCRASGFPYRDSATSEKPPKIVITVQIVEEMIGAETATHTEYHIQQLESINKWHSNKTHLD